MPKTMIKKRRFEFVGGQAPRSSGKCWCSASKCTFALARIGTDGQRLTKTFAEETAARAHADKAIREKLAKGYLEKPSPSNNSASFRPR